jgi:hypothetical protein
LSFHGILSETMLLDARAACGRDTPRDEFYRSLLGRARGEETCDLECPVPDPAGPGSRTVPA